MQPSARSRILLVASILIFSVSAASAQKRPARQTAAAYDLSRETVLQGTVLTFTSSAATPPLGARVTLQTASGPVDVHLGPASYLKANQFSLAVGDSVKVVGVGSPAPGGSIFLARVLQKGGQSLVIRSTRGFLLAPAGARALAPAQRAAFARQGGAR
jgi:hypothetical protein